MHFVGVDLAWGPNKPTGVAVLDDGGRLLEVTTVQDDDAVVAAMQPYVDGDCVVAVDAPLVVVNPTGNRPCEAALNRDFARFDAGAHPSNTGKPEFSDTPRGARLADRLGLDLDPESTAPRRAIEVYPHPATVALFRLGRTLKYKNKPGRTLAQLRGALLELMHRLEGLADAPAPLKVTHHEGWRALVAQVEQAERKSDLRRAEDQVDAVVCAYVALFAERRPELTTTYGDLATGYIVTPTLPVGHRPSPRAPRADPVQRAVQTYAARQPELQQATDGFVALVTTLLDDAGINYLSVTGRTKSIASFAAKADRTVDGKPVYTEPLEQITDQIGVRVITYLQRDVDRRRRACSPTSCACSTTATWARRPRARGGGATPAATSWSRSTRPGRPPTRPPPCTTTARRCRSAPCSSTRGPSSSTTSATRARSPRSTRPTSTAASRWPPGCSSSPTGSSPRSATGSRSR